VAEWGIERIRADRVWNSLGISGTGVVVANMDSGVDWQHPALQGSYRGYSPSGFHQHAGNWYDATGAGALTRWTATATARTPRGRWSGGRRRRRAWRPLDRGTGFDSAVA
jgi:subtilisin family serine protease